MSPLVMFNHLLFVNTFPARSLSQSAPGPPRDPEAENIAVSFPGFSALRTPPRSPKGQGAHVTLARGRDLQLQGLGAAGLTAFPLPLLSVFPGLSVRSV